MDLEVPELSAITIAPGSYGRLKVKKGAVVDLAGGTYYFDSLDTEQRARIRVNAAQGKVTVTIKNKLDIERDVTISVSGGSGARPCFPPLIEFYRQRFSPVKPFVVDGVQANGMRPRNQNHSGQVFNTACKYPFD